MQQISDKERCQQLSSTTNLTNKTAQLSTLQSALSGGEKMSRGGVEESIFLVRFDRRIVS